MNRRTFMFLFFSIMAVVVFSNAYQNIITKQSGDKQMFNFYTLVISSMLIAILYLGNILYHNHSLSKTIIFYSTLLKENTLFAFLYGLLFVILNKIQAYLLERFPVSTTSLALQITPLVGTFFYFLMGDNISIFNIIGIICIFIGAVTASFKKITIPNIIKSFENIPPLLYILAPIYAVIKAFRLMCIFTSTYSDKETILLQKYLDPITDSISGFTTPLEFIISSVVFSSIIYTCLALYENRNNIQKMKNYWKNDIYLIIIGIVINIVITTGYFYIYKLTPDKVILTAFMKITLPITLILSYFILKEKITFPQKVGITFIIAGNIINML